MERADGGGGSSWRGACTLSLVLTALSLPLFSQTDTEAPVAIYAEGKEHAMAVGLTKLSTADIRAVNKGIGVENIHYLNDGLWKTPGFAA